ncbi:MAG TPA: hypothetical protein VMY41_19470 [Thermohalobaculum sp.]|nr:hypothetical protein [Thermohalobaculum sp.]
MYKIVLSAVFASVLAHPAIAEGLISTISAVDAKQHVLVLTDKTIMLVSKEVDLTEIKSGMKVEIAAALDEDGYSLATAVTPVL